MAKRRSVARSIGERLMAAREESGLSREKAAKAAGMSALRLWRIEHNKTRALATDVEAICGALGVPVATLYGEAA